MTREKVKNQKIIFCQPEFVEFWKNLKFFVKMTENMDVKLDLMSSSGLRVIEQTKKRLFSPAQKEKIKRRSLMQAGVTETSEGENEPGL